MKRFSFEWKTIEVLKEYTLIRWKERKMTVCRSSKTLIHVAFHGQTVLSPKLSIDFFWEVHIKVTYWNHSTHLSLSLFPTLLVPPLFPFKCMDSSLIIIVKYMCTYIHTYSNFILFYVCECYGCMCISVPHAGSAHGSKKRARDSTELGEPVVVSCHIGAWNWI